MADAVKSIGVPNLVSVTISLFQSVVDGTVGMNEAEARLRKYLNELPEDQREKAKVQMMELATKLRQVSDGFVQSLTVVGSRQ